MLVVKLIFAIFIISNFNLIKIANANIDNSLIIQRFSLNDAIEIELVKQKVSEGELDIKRCSNSSLICTINGNSFIYGVKETLPEAYIKSLTLIHNDIAYKLDVEGMYSSKFAPTKNIKRSFLVWCGTSKLWCVVNGVFGEGDTAFIVHWNIRNGEVIRTNILKKTGDTLLNGFEDSNWQEVFMSLLNNIRDSSNK